MKAPAWSRWLAPSNTACPASQPPATGDPPETSEVLRLTPRAIFASPFPSRAGTRLARRSHSRGTLSLERPSCSRRLSRELGNGSWARDRWPAYMAVELWAWIQFLDWRREGHRLQTQYKDLAWLVARRISTGPRTDAGWEYYEALTHFQSSGAYDSDPLSLRRPAGRRPHDLQWIDLGSRPGTLPSGKPREPRPRRARIRTRRHPTTTWPEPMPPGLAWDWGTSTLHQEEYTGLIRDSDEALRSSTGMIGVILANHLLSAVDALVSGRLGIAGKADPPSKSF